MKIFAWNFRGLGNSHAISVFRCLLQHHHPHFIFFLLTKINSTKIYTSGLSWFFYDDAYIVDSMDAKRG